MKLLESDALIGELLDARFEALAELERCKRLSIPDGVSPLFVEAQEVADRIERELTEAMAQLPARVDGAAWLLDELKRIALAKREAAAKLVEQARRCEAQREWYEQRIVDFIESRQLPELRGDAVVLKLRNNPEKLDVAQPDIVPDKFAVIKLEMPLNTWRTACLRMPSLGDVTKEKGREYPATPIREALQAGEGVPGCRMVRTRKVVCK